MSNLIVCPACRDHEPASVLARALDAWSCARCNTRYPCLDRVPVVGARPVELMRAIASERPGDAAEERRLAPWLSDDQALARRMQRVSVAARAHWGDCSDPASAPAWTAFTPFLARLPRGDVAELGCGAGRVAFELATPGRRVVALDTDPAVLALAESIRREGMAHTSLREIGATYRPATIRAPAHRGRDVTFVLADALEPPLAAGSFDAVVALNVLDNVRVPTTLLGQLDALLAPGGTLLLSTPFSWDSAHVDDGQRIGGAEGRPFGGDPVEELRRVLDGTALGAPWRFEIEDEADVTMTLVRDARCRFVYDVRVVLARKAA